MNSGPAVICSGSRQNRACCFRAVVYKVEFEVVAFLIALFGSRLFRVVFVSVSVCSYRVVEQSPALFPVLYSVVFLWRSAFCCSVSLLEFVYEYQCELVRSKESGAGVEVGCRVEWVAERTKCV